jgi:hypothetical protein
VNIEEFLVELEKIKGICNIYGRVCPIIAVAISKRNSEFLMHWESADFLGINCIDSIKIMRAADDIEPEKPLRERILKILNLNEARAQQA